ncbi:TonB-dependent receptor [Niabella aurantiaca]|uniref:TonB-dependent receptor n=1 Tax=Niabella aurantiaca TaxID=379900 RepID=UPI0003822838|nr:TonB-dependent receptor [Niabella aurantiaca]
MKLTTFILLFLFLHAHASVNSQTVTFSGHNVTLKTIFSEIESQTGYTVAGNISLLRNADPVTIQARNEPLQRFLTRLLTNREIGFVIRKKTIVLSKKTLLPERPKEAPTPVTAKIENSYAFIKGKVTDSTGAPLARASVHVKGTANGTQTDEQGNFAIDAQIGQVLEVSFVGYNSTEVVIRDQGPITIILSVMETSLEQLVVIGYGTQKERDLTGAVTTVKGDDISRKNEMQLSVALQGLVPGVSVTRNSSIPGSSSTGTIRVRGVTTIGNSDPLILVDGVEVESIDRINPNDVENISVLKDASAASIYGSRAAAGVLLITTKKPKGNVVSLEYTGNIGAVSPSKLPENVDVIRYMQMMNEVAWNDGGNTPGNEYSVYGENFIEDYYWNNSVDPDRYPNIDWQNLILKDHALFTQQNMSINYGNDVVKLRASVNYDHADGLYANKSDERISARLNTDIKVNKFITAKINTYYFYDFDESPITNPFSSSYKYAQIAVPYWSDGYIAPGRLGANTWARINYGGWNHNQKDNFLGRFGLEIKPVKNLTVSAYFSPSVYKTKATNFQKQVSYYDIDDRSKFGGLIDGNLTNGLRESRPEIRTLTKQLYANYETRINSQHHISVMAGYEDQYKRAESPLVNTDQMVLSEFPFLDRANSNYVQVSGDASEVASQSLFGRMNYDFDKKYLLQANVRYDGSSRFASQYRWGIFPSVSAGWVLTEESFIQKLNLRPLSFMKLRASWGALGNERIGNYPYQAIMSFHDVLFFNDDKITANTSASQTSYSIRDITWETTNTWNIGFNAALFNNRLSLTGDYYKKETRNMLLQLAIPRFMGFGLPDQNAGDMHTTGWELGLGWRDQAGDFRYAVQTHISDYKSIMGNLSGIVFLGDQIIREGSEFNEWYGYRSGGLFQTQSDLDASPLLSGAEKPGDVKFIDIDGPDGKPDGVIDPTRDKTLLGGSLPRYEYGGTINLGYKGFDLSVMFQGVGKQLARLTADMAYQTIAWYTFPSFVDGNYYSEYNTPEQNLNAKFPRLSQIGYKGNNYSMSDFWLFDGSYFRLKNVSLSYTLPKQIVKRLDVKDIRIFATVSDLFSLDHYPRGWDPEASASAYIARTWTGGLSIRF